MRPVQPLVPSWPGTRFLRFLWGKKKLFLRFIFSLLAKKESVQSAGRLRLLFLVYDILCYFCVRLVFFTLFISRSYFE